MEMLLEDKNAIVYGGGGAVGGAVARTFAREAGPARRALPNVGGFDIACAAIEGLWRTFAAELGSYGIQLVVGSAGSPDTPDVQETLKLHAGATGKSFEEVLADSGSGTLLGWLPRVAEVANVATFTASDDASAMTEIIANVTGGYIVD